MASIESISDIGDCFEIFIYDSNACAKASMPVDAVSSFGIDIINSGNTNAAFGKISDCCIVPFWFFLIFDNTAYGVTSEPVPDVVGIAITGIVFSVRIFGGRYERFAYSQIGSGLVNAIDNDLDMSITLPPPTPIIKSNFFADSFFADESIKSQSGSGDSRKYFS